MDYTANKDVLAAPLFAASEMVWFSRTNDRGNTSFLINGSKSRYFLFEDLAGLYFKDKSRSVYCCSIHCGKKSYQMCRLSESEFWAIVQGKRFRVIVDLSTNRLKGCDLDMSISLADNINKVFALLDAGRDAKSEYSIEQSPCYQFIEIPN